MQFFKKYVYEVWQGSENFMSDGKIHLPKHPRMKTKKHVKARAIRLL